MGVVRADISKADELRLAYLLNFARYVTWPANTEKTWLTFCVIESTSLYERLQLAADGKDIGPRKAQAKLIESTNTINDCDVIYFPATLRNATVDSYLQAAASLQSLRVGDDDDFLQKGGDIQFVVNDGKIHFEIHLVHVRNNGLDMSSKLLKHAEHVIEDNKRTGGEK